jgi:hypothetical protein
MYALALGACCDCAGRFFKISSLHAVGEAIFFGSIPCFVIVLGAYHLLSSDEPNKSDAKRWGRYEWGAVAILAYLWGWLILWGLSRLSLLPNNNAFRGIASVIYFPIIALGALIDMFRR